jgi:hypothetical protein
VLAALALALLPAAAPGAGCPADLRAGVAGGAEADRARLLELAGQAPLRPWLFQRPSGEAPPPGCGPAPLAAGGGASLEPVQPESFSTLHTGWSDDRNDGALFGGRGLSTQLLAGLRLRWGALSAQVAPLAAWQQNRAWNVPPSLAPGLSPFANPFNVGVIDLPLRMGPTDFWTLDAGRSWVRLDAFGAAAGLSTENLWWGPGLRNALLMSATAAGFPHLFAGTGRPVDVWIGKLEAQLVWGRLAESRWFDANPANDHRLFEALTLGFEPAFAPGLFLGLARVFVFPDDRVRARHWLDPLLQPVFKGMLTSAGSDGSSSDNQLTSLMARWAFPAAGLEIHGEWARDDHAWGITDLLMEPGHSQAWLLGLQKLFPAGERLWRLHAELAHTFEMSPDNPTRGTPVFYTHGAEVHGYTHRGQMLGAGIGPQADAQFLAVDRIEGAGRLGVFAERLVRNERWFYENVAATNPKRHDLQMTFGARGLAALGPLDVEWELALAHRYKPNFGPPATGLEGLLRVRWVPGPGGP